MGSTPHAYRLTPASAPLSYCAAWFFALFSTVPGQQFHSGERLILIIEDNCDDEVLIKRTFERANLNHRIHCLQTGQDAIAYLKGHPPFDDREKFPIPDLVLLDIHLRGTSGFDVLKAIRQTWLPWHLPIVVLTSSDRIQDANQAYKLGANSFLVKPLDFENAKQLARSLDTILESMHP